MSLLFPLGSKRPTRPPVLLLPGEYGNCYAGSLSDKGPRRKRWRERLLRHLAIPVHSDSDQPSVFRARRAYPTLVVIGTCTFVRRERTTSFRKSECADEPGGSESAPMVADKLAERRRQPPAPPRGQSTAGFINTSVSLSLSLLHPGLSAWWGEIKERSVLPREERIASL